MISSPYYRGPEQRQFIRVDFPRGAGLTELPQVFYDGQRFEIMNLSLGGAALYPANHNTIVKSPEEKSLLTLQFTWADPNAELLQKSVFHGVRHGLWGVEFKDRNPELTARLTHLLQPGIEGSKMISINPQYFKEGDDLLEWYRSPIGSEVILRGINVDEIQQVDVYLQEHGVFWSTSQGLKTATMKAQRGVNPTSEMREFSNHPYFIYMDEIVSQDLLKRLVVILENIPTTGPALKVFQRKIMSSALR